MTPLDAKAARALDIVRRIDARPGISRGELADATGLGPTTVVRAVGDLVTDGIVAVDTPEVHGRAGRPTERLSIDPKTRHFVGLEFGPDHLMALVLNAGRTPVAWEEIERPPPFETSDTVLAELAFVAREVADRAGVSWSTVAGIGVAMHGVVTADGEWVVQDPEQAPIAAAGSLSRKLDRFVTAEDVSRAFALAEQRFGAGREHPDLIYVFLGSDGVGGGIFLQGSPMKSTSGVCGEIGHLPAVAGGATCPCGSKGCLETVATKRALAQRFHDHVEAGMPTRLGEDAPSFHAIARASLEHDEAAEATVRELAIHLATALGPTVNITGASRVVIGGGLDVAGERFRSDVEQRVRSCVVAPLADQVSVACAALPEYAGAWGAALQALEGSLANGRFLTPEGVR